MFRDFYNKLATRHKRASFGSPVLVVANTVLIFITSQLIAAILVGIGTMVVHPGITLDKVLNGSAPPEFFYVLLAEVIAIGLVLMVLNIRSLKLGSIGLGRWPAWRDLVKGLLGFGAFYAILIIIMLILTMAVPSLDNNQKQDVGFNALNSNLDQILGFIGLVVLPPLGEEVLVRGYLYSGLRSKMKFLPALIITSIIFGLAHLQIGNDAPLLWAAAVDTFVLSVVLIYLREKTGALYAGMLVHMLNNLIAFGVHFR